MYSSNFRDYSIFQEILKISDTAQVMTVSSCVVSPPDANDFLVLIRLHAISTSLWFTRSTLSHDMSNDDIKLAVFDSKPAIKTDLLGTILHKPPLLYHEWCLGFGWMKNFLDVYLRPVQVFLLNAMDPYTVNNLVGEG